MNKPKIICEVVETSHYYLLQVSYGNQAHFIHAVEEGTYRKLPEIEDMSKSQQEHVCCQVMLTPRVDEAHQFSISYPRLPKYTPVAHKDEREPKTIQDIAHYYRKRLHRPIQILTIEHTVTTTDAVKHSVTIN